ncbi:MAG: DUF11 domain-containing protein, partial [Rhodospirillales bacterium]|nr:DUF11 domain-containing protein [Rhodospirillales bacterium]
QTVTVFIDATVDPSVPHGTTITNMVLVTSSTDDPNLANNTQNEDTLVNAEADLWMEKTGGLLTTTGSTGNSSGTLRYFLTVHNDAGCTVDANCGDGGPSDAQNVEVVDTLPEDPKKIRVEFISPECIYNGVAHTVTCTTPVLPAGETVTYEIQAAAKGRLNAIFNTAEVSSSTDDPNAGNNSHTLETVVKGGTGNKGGNN